MLIQRAIKIIIVIVLFSQGSVIGSCPDESSIGDGFCDDATNIEDCSYDGGDCCLTFIKVDFCETCICHEDGKRHLEYGETTTEYIQCPDLSYVGDGLCDDLTNIVQCSYDGGDCCLDDKKTFYCKDCKCQNETTSSEISGTTQSVPVCPTCDSNFSTLLMIDMKCWYILFVLMNQFM